MTMEAARGPILSLASVLLVAFALVAGAGATPTQTSGALELRAAFSPRWQFGDLCPPETPASVSCVRFVGVADVPGLGRATATYTKTIETARCAEVEQFATAVISVAGKGELRLSLPGPVCGQYAPPGPGRWRSRSPAVRGCTRAPPEACGSRPRLLRQHRVRSLRTGQRYLGRDARRARPGLRPRATGPDRDGRENDARPERGKERPRPLPRRRPGRPRRPRPRCMSPRSGSLFELGRTEVACTAADSDGNTSRAGFTVSVRPRG